MVSDAQRKIILFSEHDVASNELIAYERSYMVKGVQTSSFLESDARKFMQIYFKGFK